ncbi:hypothetical protein PATSB16_16650 [Pandoraea thiooxydans]|nr:hypothetical protein PATSB16_16650 [Pandoraea thiooxydans]
MPARSAPARPRRLTSWPQPVEAFYKLMQNFCVDVRWTPARFI